MCLRTRGVPTRKNSLVDPASSVPYAISVCFARSSALSMGDTILSTVKKAARLAVYEEMMIKVKNHQTPPTIRPDRDLKAKGRRCQKHRHQLQRLCGGAEDQPESPQQSCQALLHPFPWSARCETLNVREIFSAFCSLLQIRTCGVAVL